MWRDEIYPIIKSLPSNAQDVWQYGFTEMVNNVIDHSGGRTLDVSVRGTAFSTTMCIRDDGVGIFRKITSEMGLDDERHAVLELAKGKLTTDPSKHTGEGIFFCSRVFTTYIIASGGIIYSHSVGVDVDWIFDRDEDGDGTEVYMVLRNDSELSTTDLFDKFASEEDGFGFTKTAVPVRFLRHGAEKLVSRSQAKRLLARFDRFRSVLLDFSEVDSIGRAFADEIFRVFVLQNPDVEIVYSHAGKNVEKMIKSAQESLAVSLGET